MTRAWMWQEGVRTAGVTLEADDNRLEWHQEVFGNHCAFAPRHQPLADFIANGAGRFGNPPQTVLDEIRTAIAELQTEAYSA